MEVVACEACPCFTICIIVWVAMGTCGLPWIHMSCHGYTWVAMDTCELQKALKCMTTSVLVFLHCELSHSLCYPMPSLCHGLGYNILLPGSNCEF